jgi:hypothetical protein
MIGTRTVYDSIIELNVVPLVKPYYNIKALLRAPYQDKIYNLEGTCILECFWSSP